MIVVDASVVVAIYRPEDQFHAASRTWLVQYLASEEAMAAPMLIVPELAGAVTRRTGDPALGHDAVRQFVTTRRLTLVPIDESIAFRAGELAADLQLHGADAVYVVIAERFDAPLVTWDRGQLERGGQHIRVYRPDEPLLHEPG